LGVVIGAPRVAILAACWSDGHIEQPLQLIQQAEMAMYKAKQQGRNKLQCALGASG
jgi:GGDEF domain-containing protein